MVVRIHNASKWACINPGTALALRGQGARKVRVEVNCPAPTRFDLIDGAAEVPVFVAVVQGLEVLEFDVMGEVADLVPTSDDEVWYFTNDGDTHANEAVQPESFVKIMNRRTRNPQLELMEFKMKQNERRRDAELEVERAAMREAMAKFAEQQGGDPETGEVTDGTEAEAGRGAGTATGAAGTQGAGPGVAPASEPAKAGAANG